MRRREFIAGLVGAAAWPLAGHAQQAERVRRIGVLTLTDENDPFLKAYVSAFTQALGDLGWTDGRSVRMDLRSAGGDINRIQALAQELVGSQPDILMSGSSATTAALRRETQTIPIVFVNVAEPIATGIVPRLKPHPVQGFNLYDAMAYTRVDAYTVSFTATKDGKVVQTGTWVTSADGKTFTSNITNTANGQQAVLVHEKQ
jgi:ABC-type uncharacterized transport system substrate-binding protein